MIEIIDEEQDMPKPEKWEIDSYIGAHTQEHDLRLLRRNEYTKLALAATAFGVLVFPNVAPHTAAAKAEVRIADEVTGDIAHVVAPVLEPVIDFLVPPVKIPEQQNDTPMTTPQNIPSHFYGGTNLQNENVA